MLNLKQLEYAEDSLNKQFNKQIYDFSKNLISNNYFKNERLMQDEFKKLHTRKEKNENDKPQHKQKKTQKKQIKKDSLITNSKLKQDSVDLSFNIDTTYKYLDLSERNQVIDNSLTYARAVQNNITNSRKQFEYKAETIRRHEIEWHRKFSLSFACLVFFFIGAPFGAIIRKGGFGTPVVISILFFILYYIISISGEKFAREGVMPPYMGMWLSSFILMPLGIFLTYKATTDSVILNADTYLLFFKKFFKRFSKKSD